MKLLLIFISVIFVIGNAHADSSTPVMIGGHDGLDACLTLGAVVSPKGFDEVNVYAKPNDNSSVVEALTSGTLLMICDSSGDAWSGVVFSGDGYPSCDVTSPTELRQPYHGECKSGWIETINIEILAG